MYQEKNLSLTIKKYMKQKIYKAPKNLKEKIDKKINFIETIIQLWELIGKNFPKAFLEILKIKEKNKKR